MTDFFRKSLEVYFIEMQQKLAARKGNVHEIRADWPKYARTAAPDDLPALAEPWRYTVRDGKKIGEHNGAHFYTVGQRKGLGIGGRRESLFVLATDVGQNVIYVGEGDAHPGLYRKALFMKTGDLHWIDPAERMRAGQRRRFRVRIRYRQPLQGAELVVCDEGGYLLFDEGRERGRQHPLPALAAYVHTDHSVRCPM